MPTNSCCGAVLPPDSRFCPKCGRAVANCPACGRELQPEARFCQYCGKPCDSRASQPRNEAVSSASLAAERSAEEPEPANYFTPEQRRVGSAANVRRGAKEAEDLLRAAAEQREREEEEQRRQAAEIVPGTWRMIPMDGGSGGFGGMPAGLPISVKGEFIWQLNEDGSLAGQMHVSSSLPAGLGGMLMPGGMEMQIQLEGMWSYDYKARVLSLSCTGVAQTSFGGEAVPAMPIGALNVRVRITGGSSGNWEATDESTGARCRFVRTL